MPRTTIDYSNAVVYRLIHNFTTYYVGSTTNFKSRKSKHKSDSIGYNSPIYKFIRENGGWENDWEMVLIESYPNCKSGEELRMYERHHYDILKPSLNAIKPFVSTEERKEYGKQYYNENFETIKEKTKEHYIEKREEILAYQKKYSTENKEKIKEYNRQRSIVNKEKNAEYKIQYSIDNKEKIKENKKKYHSENKEEIHKKSKVYRNENQHILKAKINCSCGGKYTHTHSSRHMRSLKHMKFSEENKESDSNSEDNVLDTNS
jgi:hypothetical protein